MTQTQAGSITVSLEIDNKYELYADVTTHATDVQVPAPPIEVDSEEYEEWAEDHIYAETGVGHEDGDSWYNVEVTASSHPHLLAVGATFEFGY